VLFIQKEKLNLENKLRKRPYFGMQA
jgi:hypothetical protein